MGAASNTAVLLPDAPRARCAVRDRTSHVHTSTRRSIIVRSQVRRSTPRSLRIGAMALARVSLIGACGDRNLSGG